MGSAGRGVEKTEGEAVMTRDEERFMAFEGLLQWTRTVITQSARVSAAREKQTVALRGGDQVSRHLAILEFHSECHFFAIAAFQLFDYRDWALTFGLCSTVDFTEIDRFSRRDIIDLRNMREHVIDYFTGKGRASDRWFVETPEYKADASSVVG
jgi:hypothetical protein